MIRSNLETSTLTVEICEDILHRSPEYSTMWTDEKHSLFLQHLEVSFVKHLHQSMSLLAPSSDRGKRNRGITKTHQMNACDTSKQLADPLHGRRGSTRVYHRVCHSKRIGMECPAASAHIPERLTFCNTEDLRKVAQPHGSDTCSLQFSTSTQFCDSHDSTKEGTGQNFVDEDNWKSSNTESRIKRLKIVSLD